MSNLPSRSQISTNVRILPQPGFAEKALRAGLQAVQGPSPGLAAKFGESLIFRTSRRPTKSADETLLPEGRRLRVASARGTLAAWSWGEGPAVVLVHGWNGRGAQLGAFVAPIVAAGFRAVAFDARGHGASPGVEATILDFVEAIDSVIDAVRPAFGSIQGIIAHSMGSAAVTHAMGRWSDMPVHERERDLKETGLPARRFAFIAPAIDMRDYVQTFSERMGLGPRAVASLERRLEARFHMPLAAMYSPVVAPKLEAPLLVVHDDADREVPPSRGAALAQAWPGARLMNTQGLGHMRILRDPHVVGEIARFVTET